MFIDFRNIDMREKHQLVAPHLTHPLPSMCPDQVLNLQPSGAGEDSPITLARAQKIFFHMTVEFSIIWNL